MGANGILACPPASSGPLPRDKIFCRIRELALYRSEYLSAKGYDVIAPSSREQALEVIRRGSFQLAVLTYTLSSDSVLEYADLLRQHCPACPLIVIANTNRTDRAVDPDEVVLADEGPEALLAARKT
jgi:ActR/RegA family two-component response regulator